MWKVTLVLFVVIIGLVEPAKAEEQWMYIDVLSTKNLSAVSMRNAIEIDNDVPSVTMGDRQYDAAFCALASQFTCVKSEVFEFGVPKELAPETKQWVINKSVYRVVGKDSIRILGGEYKILYIDRETKDGKFRYLYSTSHGLIAFVASFGNQTRSYFLEGPIGFGLSR